MIGPYGYVALFVWALVTAPWVEGPWLILMLVIIVGISLFGAKRQRQVAAWQRLLRLPVLLPLALLPLLVALFSAPKDLVVATIALSLSGLQVGAWIVLRVIVLLLAGSSFSAHISVTQIALLFEGIGLRGLGFALGVALNALPLTVRSVQDTWQALRLRGGLRRAWWRGIRLFLVATTVQIALRAEETLQAIYLRAFDPERRGQRLPWQRGDLFLSIGLIMLGVILILL